MKRRITRTPRQDSILRQPLLRKIFFISLAAAIALPFSYAFFLHPSITKILIEDKIAESITMARHLSRYIPSQEAELKRDALSVDKLTKLIEDNRNLGLKTLKIFSKSGEIIFSTNDRDMGNISNEKYFHEILAKGKAHADVVRKHAESLEGQQVPMDLVETHVPLMRDGKFEGAFEINYDVTHRQEELADLLLDTLIVLSGLAAGLLFIILVVLIGENKAIREQKQAEKALKEERDKAKRYLDIAGVVIVILDSDQKVRLINRKGVELLGYKEDEIIGKNWFEDFIPERERERMKSVFAMLMAGRIELLEYFENPILTSREEERLVAWHNSVLTDEAGAIIGTLSSGQDITDQKQAEETLRQSEETNRLHFENASDVIFSIDPDLKIISVSPSVQRIIGYKPEELKGESFLNLDLVAEEYMEAAAADAMRALAGERILSSVYEFIAKDGTRKFGEVSAAPLVREGKVIGISCIARDITERKRSEEAVQRARSHLERKVEERTAELVLSNEKLQREIVVRRKAEEQIIKSKAMLQSVFDGISDPLIMLDKNMSILMLNEAAVKYYRLSSDEDAIGRACHKAIKGESSPCEGCSVSEHTAAGTQVTFERKGFFDPGRVEQVTVYPILGARSGLGGSILRISDITENRNMEKQLIRADRLSSLGQLSGGIAHEIRNPLSGIRLFVDILCDEEKFQRTEAELEILQEIRGNILKIDSIIARILDFARGPQSTSRKIEVNSLINESLKFWYPKMRNREIKLDLALGDGLPDVHGDAIGIQQVVNNIVQNAIEAMSKEGWLSISTQNGQSSFYEGRPVVKIKFQDTGPGIAPDQQEKIFNPFFTTKPAGTGLGLAISYQIVKRHGGILTFYNNSDQGTTFIVELPATKGG